LHGALDHSGGWEEQADVQRGVYQPYNLTILSVALLAYATQGILTTQVWGLVLVCLPATLLGAYGGIRLYGRVANRQFRYLALWVLLASGLVLTVSNLPSSAQWTRREPGSNCCHGSGADAK
jgi:uncharacterized protein